MNLGKAFTYPFEDKLWASKLGIGMAVSIVPILNFAWLGYMIDVMRGVVSGRAEPLPGWDNFGKKFMDGLILFLASLVYALPALILIGLPMLFMIVPAILSSNGNMQDVANAAAAAGSFVLLCLSCIFLIYVLALSIIYPAIYVEYARQGTFASCFQFKVIFGRIGKNAGAFFTAWGIYLATAIASGIVGGIVGTVIGWIPCLGQLVALVVGLAIGVYTSLVFSHLFGQFSTIESSSNPPATA
jgi:hypothetical protein